jgi:hypothetical protein
MTPAFVAGCGVVPRPPKTPPSLLAQLAARRAHVAAVTPFAVPPDFTRTTPKPPADLLAVAPELKGVAKLAFRLHPRYCAIPPEATQSNLGGPLLWPAVEPYPVTADGKLLAPVLQLRRADAPPQVTFPEGRDLLQLFWNPRFEAGRPRASVEVATVWRESGGLSAGPPHPLAPLARGEGDPDTLGPAVWTDFLPLPCRLAPERMLEFPAWEILPRPMRDRVAAAVPGGEAAYRHLLSVAPGTKVGGYAPAAALPEAKPPACPTCSWGMDYLLTVAEAEWDGATAPRWKPAEDTQVSPQRTADGLSLGPAAGCSLFVCRRCEGWPVALTT